MGASKASQVHENALAVEVAHLLQNTAEGAEALREIEKIAKDYAPRGDFEKERVAKELGALRGPSFGSEVHFAEL